MGFHFNFKNKFIGLTSIAITVIVLFLFLGIRKSLSFLTEPYEELTFSLIDDFPLVMNVVFNVFISHLLTHIMKYLGFLNLFRAPFEMLKKKNHLPKHIRNERMDNVLKIIRRRKQ